MASTYSNLKIQLMATGENSGTWGNVTNDNLGVAIEQAITGSVDVTVNADTTLTLTDTNAAQNARALRLNLGGSGGFNLTVPAIQKLYLINNASLAAIVVKNASGSTVTVPTAKTMWVFSTGTGVVDAVTHLTSLTLGSALPIASGGTGSTSTTYANLQTNVTGTLPIANGGTGSTSTTYANLQSNVSGTLPIANGGTGSTSTTYANLQSNVSGTLPIANGGTGSTSTTYANLQSNVSGTLPVANGGTGSTSLTANRVLLGNGTSGLQEVAPGSNGNVLTSNGSTWTSAAPSGGVTSLNGQTGAITDTGFNNIGSYSCGRGVAGTSYNVGATVSGSSIAQVRDGNTGPFAACQSDVGPLVGSNQGQTGTWRAMAASSAFTNEGTSFSSSTLWVRIS
jgi:hypothetical protein